MKLQHCFALLAVFSVVAHAGVKPQGTIPLRVEVPSDAVSFSLVIDDANGMRVRNLISNAAVADYAVEKKGDATVLEVLWDGHADGPWSVERESYVGDTVAAGAYTLRGIYHKGIGVRHAGSFGNPGTPPWPTAEGTGEWMCDHSVAHDAAVVPSHSKAKGRVFFCANGGEVGDSVIALGIDGRKVWGWHMNAASMVDRVAADDKYLYVTLFQEHRGSSTVLKLDADNGRRVPFGTNDCLKFSRRIKGVTALNGKLALCVGGKPAFILNRDTGDTMVDKIGWSDTLRMNFTPEGDLVTMNRTEVFRWYAADGAVRKLTIPGASFRPTAFWIAEDGRFYVSDWDSQTIRVFSNADTNMQELAVVGEPGGREPGPFNPRRMTRPWAVAVENRPDGKQYLYCVESGENPRRTAVWDITGLPGKPAAIVRDYCNGVGFMGTWGGISDDVPGLGMLQGVLYDVDLTKPGYTPTYVLPGAHRRFILVPHNGYHFLSSVSGTEREYYTIAIDKVKMEPHNFIFMRKGAEWKPVAFVGYAAAAARNGFPPLTGKGGLAFWSDLNGDGEKQAEEVSQADALPPSAEEGVRCERDLAWYYGGNAIRPERFTETGIPVYSSNSIQRLPADAGKAGNQGQWPALRKTRFGYVKETSGRLPDTLQTRNGYNEIQGFDTNGVTRWRYPACWPREEGMYAAPEARPGLILGSLRISGTADMGGHSIVAVRGYNGQEYLLRDDGLYVGELFTDYREAEGMPEGANVVGKPVDKTTMGPDPSNGTFTRQRDGKVRLCHGYTDVRIAEVVGLDTVADIAPKPLQLTEEQLKTCAAFVPTPLEKLPKVTQWTIPKGGPFDADAVAFDKDAMLLAAGQKEFARVLMRYDEKNLYVAWQVRDRTPFVNRGHAPEMAFKTGDCVGLLCAAGSGGGDRKRRGGIRILITRFEDRIVAVKMRAGGKPTAEFHFQKTPYHKTWTGDFRHLAVEPSVTASVKPMDGGYVVTAALPWATLECAPAAGAEFAGDVEAIFGTDYTTHHVQRVVRWADKETTYLTDTCMEAEGHPARWGTWRIE